MTLEPLPEFQLPFPPTGPPAGYDLDDGDFSTMSRTTAFVTGLDQRDMFLGQTRCVVCGLPYPLQHCHVIPQSEPGVWLDLKARGWIPPRVKGHVEHEPRNGLIMCLNHHFEFNRHYFFIRYTPKTSKFVFVNYSNKDHLRQFHGKAIALNVDHHHAPLPSVFIIHEMRVRGYYPFQPTTPAIPDDSPWQDWIELDGVYDNASGTFNRETPPANDNNAVSTQPQFQPSAASAGGAPSGYRTLPLNADVIADILAATRAMPSWKACMIEGTSWDGSAEENVQKYITSIGIQDHQSPVDPRNENL